MYRWDPELWHGLSPPADAVGSAQGVTHMSSTVEAPLSKEKGRLLVGKSLLPDGRYLFCRVMVGAAVPLPPSA